MSALTLQLKCQMFFFQLVTNQKFDIGVMIVILLNMMTMAIEHYQEPQELSDILHYINIIFVTIFTIECSMKLIALRWHYFKQLWNIFDFAVVVLSILGEHSSQKHSHLNDVRRSSRRSWLLNGGESKAEKMILFIFNRLKVLI